jgi:hypothetical protein
MADEFSPTLDGLVTFYASHHAVRAEKVLKKNDFSVMLVPGPREISPNCGNALQLEYDLVEQVDETLKKNKVQIEALHHYKIELSQEELDRFQS